MTYIIACPDQKSCDNLKKILDDISMTFQGYFTTLRAAEASIREEPPDMAFIWLRIAALNGVRLVGTLRKRNPNAKIIFVSSQREDAVEAFEYGANGFLLIPFSKKEIGQLLRRFIR